MEIYKSHHILPFATQQDWLDWLEENHSTAKGLWVKFAKKASGIPSLTYEEAREAAIMYGWIDGLKNAIDENYYTLRFMPRLSKSGWSKVNTGIAEQLIKDGKMRPTGLEQVEKARADGRWEAAYHSQSTMEMPADFAEALKKNPTAEEFFASITKANRYAFLYRLQTAKKAETRAARLEKFIEMLSAGDVFHF